MIDAIEKLITLSKARPDPSFWDANIIEAHELCRDEMEQRHFYCYLTNPESYVPATVANIETRILPD